MFAELKNLFSCKWNLNFSVVWICITENVIDRPETEKDNLLSVEQLRLNGEYRYVFDRVRKFRLVIVSQPDFHRKRHTQLYIKPKF